MNFKYFSLMLFPFLRLDMFSSFQQDFLTWMNELMSGLIQVFNSFVEGLSGIVLYALSSAIGGILGFIGVPFTSWSQFVANNGGWFIPIIFVGILGLAFLVAEAINLIYGFEKDISSGESDISSEEQHIAEEEAE
ncbi:MAG: hypothetical protein ACP5L4_01845 [Thermoplasmata archaeon]